MGALRELTLFFPVFLLSLCVHEWAHAQVATWLGDQTPKWMGRLTLNPMAHADLMGTVVFPVIAFLAHIPLFGWAKPVPVNEKHFKKPIRDMAIVAAAGPFSNVVLALLCAVAIGLITVRTMGFSEHMAGLGRAPTYLYTLQALAERGIYINIFLCVFNMIPLGPLDGAKVILAFLPLRWHAKFSEIQAQGGTILMMVLLLGWIRPELSVFRWMAVPVMGFGDYLRTLFV